MMVYVEQPCWIACMQRDHWSVREGISRDRILLKTWVGVTK